MARPKPPAPTLVSADDIELELYESMRKGDIERLMGLWSDDDEICCIHPGGARLVGAAAIRASFEAMFGNGTIDAEPHRVRRLESHSSAVHRVLERIRVATPEGDQFAWVVATNVYLKSSQGWRLVAHHASPGTSVEKTGPAGDPPKRQTPSLAPPGALSLMTMPVVQFPEPSSRWYSATVLGSPAKTCAGGVKLAV